MVSLHVSRQFMCLSHEILLDRVYLINIEKYSENYDKFGLWKISRGGLKKAETYMPVHVIFHKSTLISVEEIEGSRKQH